MTDLRPTVGSDRDTWGTKLLTWLGVSTNTDGTLVAAKVAAALPSSVDGSGVLLPAAVKTALGGSLAPLYTVADVFIYRDSGGYAVGVDKTGSVVAKATDHASVFQDAYDSLKTPTSTGSLIRFNGVFTWNTGVTGYTGISLQGAGMQEAFNQGYATYIDGSTINGSILTLVKNPNQAGTGSFPNLKGFVIYGGGSSLTSQNGIEISNANGDWLDWIIEDIGIYKCGNYGIYNPSGTGSKPQTWGTRVYLETNGGGILWNNSGSLALSQLYMYNCQNTSLFGISSNSPVLIDKSHINSNLGTAIKIANGDLLMSDSYFSNNGSSSLPTITDTQDAIAPITFTLHDSYFYDTRGASAVTTHISLGSSNTIVAGQIHDNTFNGMQGKAITATARAGYAVNIHDNNGYNNTYGLISTPWHTSDTAVAIFGTASAPTASTAYSASLGPVYIVSSGGTAVSITIKNGNGDTIQSGLSTFAGVLPFNWSINFGAFSVAPTTVVSVV